MRHHALDARELFIREAWGFAQRPARHVARNTASRRSLPIAGFLCCDMQVFHQAVALFDFNLRRAGGEGLHHIRASDIAGMQRIDGEQPVFPWPKASDAVAAIDCESPDLLAVGWIVSGRAIQEADFRHRVQGCAISIENHSRDLRAVVADDQLQSVNPRRRGKDRSRRSTTARHPTASS